MRLVTSPALYAAWFVIVLASLVASYFFDPHVFGFTTLGLGVVSIPVAVLAIAVGFRPLAARAKLAILAFMALTAIAILGALELLGTFKWA